MEKLNHGDTENTEEVSGDWRGNHFTRKVSHRHPTLLLISCFICALCDSVVQFQLLNLGVRLKGQFFLRALARQQGVELGEWQVALASAK